jgi:hypothetical protein
MPMKFCVNGRFVLITLALTIVSVLAVSCGERGDTPELTLAGKVTNGVTGVSDIAIDVTGTMEASGKTGGTGEFSFGGLVPGRYTVEPLDYGYTFEPAQYIVITEISELNVNFKATPVP